MHKSGGIRDLLLPTESTGFHPESALLVPAPPAQLGLAGLGWVVGSGLGLDGGDGSISGAAETGGLCRGGVRAEDTKLVPCSFERGERGTMVAVINWSTPTA